MSKFFVLGVLLGLFCVAQAEIKLTGLEHCSRESVSDDGLNKVILFLPKNDESDAIPSRVIADFRAANAKYAAGKKNAEKKNAEKKNAEKDNSDMKNGGDGGVLACFVQGEHDDAADMRNLYEVHSDAVKILFRPGINHRWFSYFSESSKGISMDDFYDIKAEGSIDMFFRAVTGADSVEINSIFDPEPESCKRYIRPFDHVAIRVSLMTTTGKTVKVGSVGDQSAVLDFKMVAGTNEGMILGILDSLIGKCQGSILESTIPSSLAYGTRKLPGLPANSSIIAEIEVVKAQDYLDFEMSNVAESEAKRRAKEKLEKDNAADIARQEAINESFETAKKARKEGSDIKVTAISPTEAACCDYVDVEISGTAVNNEDIASFVKVGESCDEAAFENFAFVDMGKISVNLPAGEYKLCYKHWKEGTDTFSQGGWTEYPALKLTLK